MPANAIASDATLDSNPQKTSSIATRLVQAAALAAVLVPLGSVAVETAPLTCGFGSYYGMGSGCSSSTATSNRFDFGAYFFDLSFTGLSDSFFVTVTDHSMTAAEFELRDELFEDYQCIALTPDGLCRDFEVAVGTTQNAWTHYDFEIHWNAYLGMPNYDPDRVRVLHDIGITGTNAYDEDMCLQAQQNSSYSPCVFNPDPGIRSGNTDFRSFTAALAPAAVPEPSSLLLLGTGMTGFLYQCRRRRHKSETEPTA